MTFIQRILTVLIFFLSCRAYAEKLQISPTFSLTTNITVTGKEVLPSLNTQLIHLKKQNQNFDLMVVRNNPPNLANMFSVKRYWKTAQVQTATSDKNIADQGCKRLTSRTYRCDRYLGQSGKFLVETLYWNAKNDLVLVRVSSKKSFSEALAVAEKIEMVANSRLPAGQAK